MYSFRQFSENVHRLIPSKFLTTSVFDWADSAEELEQIAVLEGLTNERILSEVGKIQRIKKEDWIGGPGSTPLMAAFAHAGFASRFSDGSFGVYYAASSLETAIRKTCFHRERFYGASHEKPCSISMREYIARLTKPLIDIHPEEYKALLNPDPASYGKNQAFGKKIRDENHWGLLYPSVRNTEGLCVAVLRPPALTLPVQGCHLEYIWDGEKISEVYRKSKIRHL